MPRARSLPARIAILVAAASVASTLAASHARAADRSGQTTSARRLVSEVLGSAELREGERYDVTGRYVELQDNEVVLFEFPARFVIPHADLRRDVMVLAGDGENLAFRTTCIRPGGSRPVFRVDAVSTAPSTREILEQDMATLEALGPEHAWTLLDLARRIVATDKRFGEDGLDDLAWTACLRALLLRDSLHPPDDAESRLADVRRMHELFPDRKLALQVLAKLETRFPRSDGVRAMLIEIGCRKFRGRWMTQEEFRSLQGYEKHEGEWVSVRERALRETIEALLARRTAPILRRRLDREYHVLAGKGQVAVGMKPEEVYRALGFPDRVFRRRAGSREIDQWVYGDRYYFFLDNLLLKFPGNDSELRDR